MVYTMNVTKSNVTIFRKCKINAKMRQNRGRPDEEEDVVENVDEESEVDSGKISAEGNRKI